MMELIKTKTRHPGADALRSESHAGTSRSDRNFYIVLGVMVLLYLVFDWYRFMAGHPGSPVFVGLAVALILAYCVYKTVTARNYADPPEWDAQGGTPEGRNGEAAGGIARSGIDEALDHPLPCDVIVSEHGIFAVVTKTLTGVSGVIENLGPVIKSGDYMLLPNPVLDARTSAKRLRSALKEATGKELPVTPVIVFPGQRVEDKVKLTGNAVHVMNPEDLPSFIERQPLSISPEDKKLAESHLSAHTRAAR